MKIGAQAKSLVMFNNVTFITVSSSGYTVGQTDLGVVPSLFGGGLGPRAIAVAPQYRYWRLKRLKVTVMMNFGGVAELSVAPIGVTIGVAYSPGYVPSEGAPASFTDLTSFPVKRMSNGFQKIVMTVPPRVIRQTLYPRFRTTTTGSPSNEEVICGSVWYLINLNNTPASNVQLYSLIEGLIEFEDPCDSGLSLSHIDRPMSMFRICEDDEKAGPSGRVATELKVNETGRDGPVRRQLQLVSKDPAPPVCQDRQKCLVPDFAAERRRPDENDTHADEWDRVSVPPSSAQAVSRPATMPSLRYA
jgi:hypothetical protein